VILADSSIWVDHLRRGRPELATALDEGLVLTHPFVIGELACGNIANRAEVLALLRQLPRAIVASDEEVLAFIEARSLGRGLGLIDVHLVAAAALSGDVAIWTRDRRLQAVARTLGLAY
jgi:predicted nucleic acid-binding protein